MDNEDLIEANKVSINIEECITSLGISRRRLYDIINILECFRMVKRMKKNRYTLKPVQAIT